MIPWLADCAKEKKMIPRKEWLERMGEPTRYFEAIEHSRPTEFALRMMCMEMRNGRADENRKGILMRMETKSFLESLISPKKGPERE